MVPNPYDAPREESPSQPPSFWGIAFRNAVIATVTGVLLVQTLVMTAKRWSFDIYDDGLFSKICMGAMTLLNAGVISMFIAGLGLAANWFVGRKSSP